MKKSHKKYLVAMLAITTVFAIASPAWADVLGSIQKMNSMLFAITKALGVGFGIWGGIQLGLSIQQHDPSQRSNGILTIVGALFVFFLEDIITLITT